MPRSAFMHVVPPNIPPQPSPILGEGEKRRRAFTLIELLVVISIIGLLSAMAAVSMNSARAKGRDAKRLADLKQVRAALELYVSDNNAYPTCGQACATYCDCTTAGWGANWANMELKPTYLAAMPTDPTNNSSYGYFYARGYRPTGSCSWALTNSSTDYIIATRLENPSAVPGSCSATFTAWGRSLNFLAGVGM